MNAKFFKILRLISSLVVIAVIAIVAYFGYGFYRDYNADKLAKSTTIQNTNAESTESNDVIDWNTIRDNSKNIENIGKNQEPAQVVKKQDLAQQDKKQDLAQAPAVTTLAPPKKQARQPKPKLAIIMDDIAYKSQLNDLQKLNLPITPSFFPVSPDTPDTAKLAASVPFYMVHLPLEAHAPQQSRQKWILVGSSKDEIRAQIATIKQHFPKLMFINNHTGSKFTASQPDMENLLQILQEFGIEFVDSRTSVDTIAPKLYQQAQRPLLSRDVFLDNTLSVSYTTDQLKRAIKLAKKNGYAIAICHPRPSTFKALANAKSSLFKEVELVYLKDLPVARTLLTQNLARSKSTPSAQIPESIPESTPQSTLESKAPPSPSSAAQPSPNTQDQSPTTPQEGEVVELFDTMQSDDIPHNAYLDKDNDPVVLEEATQDAPESGAKPIAESAVESVPESPEEKLAVEKLADTQATPPQAPSHLTPPANTAIAKPSKIDPTMFKEAKRISKERKANNAQAKPRRQTSKKEDTKATTSPQSCAKNEVEAFVSGCLNNKAKNKQGFVNIEWNSDQQKSSKKPKDFLDSSDL